MIKSESKNAAIIGTLCITTYVVNYYLRHILSVLTPRLLETGRFTVELIGVLSSTYMVLYAAGQLVNGFLGDCLPPKKMVAVGISLAGTVLIVFPFVNIQILQILCFAVLGFGLSMQRGPLMKIISENTAPAHARIICVFFSFASFAGPLIASIFAMINSWNLVFIAAGVTAILVGIAAYTILSTLENRGKLSYKTSKGQGFSSILTVFKIEKFVFYMIVACLVEICAASISFWIPTFLTDSLLFEKNSANFIFTLISVIRSFMPFVSLIIFRFTKGRDIVMTRVAFFISAVMFCAMIFAQNRWLTLVLLILALLCTSCTSALVWSIFIPSLGKTGKVSSVNGVLDCAGYIAAAVANLLFAAVMSGFGWNAVILLWALIGVTGVVASFFVKEKKQELDNA